MASFRAPVNVWRISSTKTMPSIFSRLALSKNVREVTMVVILHWASAAAVDSLPHDQREVLVLKIWNELTFSEIAGALGISQNTAASRYRYALAHLKKSLQPQ